MAPHLSTIKCGSCKYFKATTKQVIPHPTREDFIIEQGKCNYPMPLAYVQARRDVLAHESDCPTWKERR